MAATINELLPIGSVVGIKGAEKRLMIYGIKQISAEESEPVEYDYIGVLYPEGNLGQDKKFLFNHEDIETIFHTGYADEEREIFIATLNVVYSSKVE